MGVGEARDGRRLPFDSLHLLCVPAVFQVNDVVVGRRWLLAGVVSRSTFVFRFASARGISPNNSYAIKSIAQKAVPRSADVIYLSFVQVRMCEFAFVCVLAL